MKIGQFRHDDVNTFLALAAAEGWICDRWEFDFLLNAFPQGCLVGRVEGRAVAFITAIKYDKSGWIGNLLVREDLRGHGAGGALMKSVLDVLRGAGTETVWLTASEAGRGIYERLGFTYLDTIQRWRGKGVDGKAPVPAAVSPARIMAVDESGWGDRREAIIDAVTERGTVLGSRNGFLVIQGCGDSTQLGPWGCASGEDAVHLLDEALLSGGAWSDVFLDVPVGNTLAAALLSSRGFVITGSTTLMCLGRSPRYAPGRVFALASMGSMG